MIENLRIFLFFSIGVLLVFATLLAHGARSPVPKGLEFDLKYESIVSEMIPAIFFKNKVFIERTTGLFWLPEFKNAKKAMEAQDACKFAEPKNFWKFSDQGNQVFEVEKTWLMREQGQSLRESAKKYVPACWAPGPLSGGGETSLLDCSQTGAGVSCVSNEAFELPNSLKQKFKVDDRVPKIQCHEDSGVLEIHAGMSKIQIQQTCSLEFQFAPFAMNEMGNVFWFNVTASADQEGLLGVSKDSAKYFKEGSKVLLNLKKHRARGHEAKGNSLRFLDSKGEIIESYLLK